jgi:hypothetical protein
VVPRNSHKPHTTILRALLDPPTLLKHVREQNVRSGHIDSQDSPQRIPKPLIDLACRCNRLVHEPALARDAEGVEDHEGVIPVVRRVSILPTLHVQCNEQAYLNQVHSLGTPMPESVKTKYE